MAERGDSDPLADKASSEPALTAELQTARETIEEKKRAQLQLDREIVELRTMLRESERQLANIRRTLSYRLGSVLVDARTVKGLTGLPKALFDLWRIQREKRLGTAIRGNRPADRLRYVDTARDVMRREGIEGAIAFIAAQPERHRSERARAMLELAAAMRATEPARAAQMGVEAALLSPAEGRLRHLIFELYDEGYVNSPAAILERTDPELLATAAQGARAAAIRADARELVNPLAIPPRAAIATPSDALAVITPRSLPSHAEALTYRAAAIAAAASHEGRKAFVITQPGYRYPASGDGSPRRIAGTSGIETIHLPAVAPHPNDLAAWVAETADALRTQLVDEGAGAVHVIGVMPLALAAATAAHQAGLPFTFDIGAIPSAGGVAESRDSERFAATWSRFATLAHAADRVIVRSTVLANVLRRTLPDVAFQVERDELPDTFVRAAPASVRDVRRELGIPDSRPLIGIITEGDRVDALLQIVRALPLVRARVPDATIVFCGPGRVGQSIRREAAVLRLGDAVVVPDGFARQRLAHYVSSFAAMVFPPIEPDAPGLAAPFELRVALALETPVVAGACDWAREWCKGESRVVLAERADSHTYAEAILACLTQEAVAVEPQSEAAPVEAVRAKAASPKAAVTPPKRRRKPRAEETG